MFRMLLFSYLLVKVAFLNTLEPSKLPPSGKLLLLPV